MERTAWAGLIALACLVGTASAPARAQDVAAVADTDPEQAIRDMLEATRKIAHEGGGYAYADAWDAATMVKALLAEPDLGSIPKAKKRLITLGISMGLRQGFSQDASLMDYERMQVRKVEIDGDRATAVIRGWDADDIGLSWRLWLVRRQDAWRIYDAEELSQGIRVSRLMFAATASTLADGEAPEWVLRIQGVVDAATAAAEGEWQVAENLLAEVEDVEFPPDLEAMRAMLHGAIALQLYDDAEGALRHTGEIAKHSDVNVAGELIRGRALLVLERPSEVLPAVERYMAVTGPDATALTLRAEALEELGRHKEAIAAMRAASGDSPADTDVIATWLLIAEGKEHAEPLRVFKTLRNPDLAFEPIVVFLEDVEDDEALHLLFEAMAQVRPEHADLAYWRASRALAEERPAEGIDFLRPAVEAFRDAGTLDLDETWPWVSLWCDLHQEAGRLRDAYAAVAGGTEPFVAIGLRLLDEEDVDGLAAVVDAHGEHAPDDPWGLLFRADVLTLRGTPEKVEELLAPVAGGTGDEFLDDGVAERRVAAFVAAGRAVGGFQAMGPDSFSSFGWAVYQAGDGATLSELTDRYAAVEPHDTLVPFFRIHELFLNGKNAEALALYEAESEAMGDFGEWMIFDSAARAALRCDQQDKALQIAQRARVDQEQLFLYAVVRIVRGDESAQVAARASLEYDAHATMFLQDADAESALKTESMAELRTWLEGLAAD
jgi:tetratricopeptide (TPR) repeat protein